MIKKFFKGIISSVKSFFSLIINVFKSFIRLCARGVKSLWKKVLAPFFKFIYKFFRLLFIYAIFLPIKYTCSTLYKFVYYILFVPARYLLFKFLCYVINPLFIATEYVCCKAAILCYFIYKKMAIPTITCITKCIRKFILKPFYKLLKLICRGIYAVTDFAYRCFINTFKFFYRYILCPIGKCFKALFKLLHRFLKGIKFILVKSFHAIGIAVVHIGKFLYKYFLEPFHKSLKLIYHGICAAMVFMRRGFVYICKQFYRYILCPIGKCFKALFKLLHRFLKGIKFILVKSFHAIGIAVVHIGKFLYKYMIYPIYFLLKAVSKAVRTVMKFILKYLQFIIFKIAELIYSLILYPIFFLLWKLLNLLRLATIKIAAFVYRYFFYPLYVFFRAVFRNVLAVLIFLSDNLLRFFCFFLKKLGKFLKKAGAGLKFAILKLARLLKALFKFLYQAILIILFLPFIVAFFLILTFVTSPYVIIVIEIPGLKRAEGIHKALKVFLHPVYVFTNRRQKGRKKIMSLTAKKSDLSGLMHIKHICGLITLLLWSVMIYPLGIIVCII